MALLALASAVLATGIFAPSAAAVLQVDVNSDCKVNIFDLAAVGLAFGSTNGSGNWNPSADINADGAVDIFDLAAVGLAFGDMESPCVVPLDFRVALDWSNINQLANYDAVQQIGYSAIPSGNINFENGSWVHSGWRFFTLDNGVKPQDWDENITFLVGYQTCGVFDTDNTGWYAFLTSNAIRGDKTWTYDVDEGLNIGVVPTLVAERLSDGTFFHAAWSPGQEFVFAPGANGFHNIIIDRNSPVHIPEPATVVLLSISGLLLLPRRRNT